VPAGAQSRRNVISVFAVSKVGLDKDGRVTDVLWGRVNTRTNRWASREVVAPVIARSLGPTDAPAVSDV
jgi:hypothetical protein